LKSNDKKTNASILIFIVAFVFSLHSNLAISEDEDVRTDMGELQEYLTLDQPINEVKWEIFGTPEWSHGLPAPTDYISIVISAPLTPNIKLKNTTRGRLFSTINSARPWLSSIEVKIMKMSSTYGTNKDKFNCAERKYFSKNTDTFVIGFECITEDRYLAYAILEKLGTP